MTYLRWPFPQKNEYLAGKLIKAGVKPRFNHANAAAMAEMPEILEQIVKGDPSVLTESKVADYYIEENGKEAYENMLIASLSNIEEQRIDAMLYKFERIATDRGLDNLTAKIAARNAEALYDEFKAQSGKSVPRRPSLGMVQSDHYGELPSEYKEYSQAVTSYNSECTEMLSRAIAVKDWSLANKIIGLMKPNLEWNNLGDWEDVVTHSGNSSVYNAFKVSQNNTEDIDAARKMLNEAKKQ